MSFEPNITPPITVPPNHYYKCSLCASIVAADGVTSHMRYHKAQPGWKGTLTYTLVVDGE